MGKYMSETATRRVNGFLATAGYNIGTLADALKMSRATLSSRINGKTDFTRSEMERIAQLLGSSAEDIFFVA